MSKSYSPAHIARTYKYTEKFGVSLTMIALFFVPLRTEQNQAMEKDIYLAGGCFWGTEHFFRQIAGVVLTEVGFANGHIPDPSYKEVYTDATGHAETVHVRYDPAVVGLKFLLRMFFRAIDPTSLNKQGEDEGTRYRTGIYYTDPADLPKIRSVYDEVQRRTDGPVRVEVGPMRCFYRAEEYHQDYLVKNPDGYCHLPLDLFRFAREASPVPDDPEEEEGTKAPMDEYSLQRIVAMEAAFDRTAEAVRLLEEALDRYESIRPDIDRLTDYLESGAWREDFEADEAGFLPGGIKRGVLSEDGLYNLLEDIVRLHGQMEAFLEDPDPEAPTD